MSQQRPPPSSKDAVPGWRIRGDDVRKTANASQNTPFNTSHSLNHNRHNSRTRPSHRYSNSTETSMPSKPIRPITPSYTVIANQEPVTLSSPQKLLVVLDLNGTLFYRAKNNIRTVTARPHLDDFLDFLFNHCRVMVWSSAQPVNVQKMLSHGFGNRIPLLDRVWARDMFRLPQHDYVRKVLTIKDLEFIWEGIEQERKLATKEELAQEKLALVFDQTNTVLIDDSTAKIQLQPYNGLALKEFDEQHAKSGTDDELPKVIKYLEKLIYQQNVSAYMRLHPFTSVEKSVELEDLMSNLNLSGEHSKPTSTAKADAPSNATTTPVAAIKIIPKEKSSEQK
ncbi:hypothetical protein BG004_004024 [Podila humilis]|nr:hypothetical protein BG004_004024 [Podila humilis]